MSLKWNSATTTAGPMPAWQSGTINSWFCTIVLCRRFNNSFLESKRVEADRALGLRPAHGRLPSPQSARFRMPFSIAASSANHPSCQVGEFGALALHEETDAEDSAGGVDETGRGRQQEQHTQRWLPPGNP